MVEALYTFYLSESNLVGPRRSPKVANRLQAKHGCCFAPHARSGSLGLLKTRLRRNSEEEADDR